MLRRIGKNCIVLAFWLGLWALLARLVDLELLLPGPLTVLRRLAELVLTADFWQTAAMSIARILMGVIAGILLGTLLAVLTSRFRFLNGLFSPLLTVIKSTPVACFSFLVLIWVGRNIVPSIIVILMVVPVVWGNVSAGIAGADRTLLEMAKNYRIGPWRTARRVYVPAVLPHFLSACRTAQGLAWKAGVAAEALILPKRSIGYNIYFTKQYLETTDLFAWTVVVILLSLLIEKLLSAVLRRIPAGGDVK